MRSHFRHIDPDNASVSSDQGRAYAGNDENFADLCFDAQELVGSACAFFSGVFPTQTAHFWWGDAVNLSWVKEYWSLSSDRQMMTRRPIRVEVERLAGEILTVWDDQVDGGRAEPAWGVSFLSPVAAASSTVMMQALAVEVLLSVDGFFDCLSRGEQALAMRWLSAAFKGIIECTLQAQLILGNPSENARVAAHARHRENHDLKRQVFAWLDEHFSGYKSMDSAAEAIAGIVVPVKFRTARDWVGQWKRRPPSARTP
jgi:hypothetical protein